MRYKEEQTQVACVRWFGLQYPEYALLLHHSPNGGYRTAYEGKAFKSMGTRAGFPDLIFLLPRGKHPFLCIEFKTDKGRQTESQKAYQSAVESVGAVYAVCRSFDEFKTTIENYLKKNVEITVTAKLEQNGRVLKVEEIERIASQIRLEDGELLTHKSRQLDEDLLKLWEIKDLTI